jgi:transcriptional regulator with GAF, ATPase, and Fis domain
LIRGESGTGKELVADAIHRRSRRSGRPLVKVNCAALVESLLLSELFGHERGAFTGATDRRKGRFEVADGGTIFLDEIGDISPATQVALLRVLQNQEFERVGGTTQIKVDVRIICATNRNLEQLVADGTFREDLYYRLKGFVIDVSALRERPEDVPLLVEHFLQLLARERDVPQRSLTDDALRLLCSYSWPGNVRELENLLRSVSLLSDSAVLDTDDFADYPELRELRRGEGSAAELSPYQQIRQHGLGLREFKKQIEYECILEALSEAEGSITGAARLLGIKRPRLSQLVKEYGISVR